MGVIVRLLVGSDCQVTGRVLKFIELGLKLEICSLMALTNWL